MGGPARELQAQRLAAKKKVRLKERRPDTISVTVGKTIQVVQFEPVHVSVTQTYTLTDEDDVTEARADLYNQCGKAVVRFMNNELKRWNPESKDE